MCKFFNLVSKSKNSPNINPKIKAKITQGKQFTLIKDTIPIAKALMPKILIRGSLYLYVILIFKLGPIIPPRIMQKNIS